MIEFQLTKTAISVQSVYGIFSCLKLKQGLLLQGNQCMIDNVDVYLPYIFYKGEMEGVAIKTEPDSESRRGANILKLRVQLN